MPKVPKSKRKSFVHLRFAFIHELKLASDTSRAIRKARSLDPRHVNVAFREALGLSTSDADIHEFMGIKKALRELVERHYDYNISEKEQKDDTREAFAAEVRWTSVIKFVIAD
jgi:hypothetical protein